MNLAVVKSEMSISSRPVLDVGGNSEEMFNVRNCFVTSQFQLLSLAYREPNHGVEKMYRKNLWLFI